MDESHVTLPQVGGMYFGDKSRKESLIEHGFRLPSAADNRPLKMPEFPKDGPSNDIRLSYARRKRITSFM